MNGFKTLLALSATLFLFAINSAGAGTITFEALNGQSDHVFGDGSETFTLDGFLFTYRTGGSGGSYSILNCASPCVTNGTTAYYEFYSGNLQMQRQDGGLFSLISADAANPFAPAIGARLELYGMQAPDTANYFTTFVLPEDYHNVSSVLFSGATSLRASFALDNIVYTLDAAPVPLPAAAWLLLSGIGGLGAMARRNRPLSREGMQK